MGHPAYSRPRHGHASPTAPGLTNRVSPSTARERRVSQPLVVRVDTRAACLLHAGPPRPRGAVAVADHGSISARGAGCTRRSPRSRGGCSAWSGGRARACSNATRAARGCYPRAAGSSRGRGPRSTRSRARRDARPPASRSASFPSTEAWLLPRLLPLLDDDLHPVVEADGLQAVADGRLDAALVSDWTDPPPGITVIDLLREPYLVLCPPGHALLAQHTLGARALRAQHIVSAPHPDCGHRLAETGVSQRMAGSLARRPRAREPSPRRRAVARVHGARSRRRRATPHRSLGGQAPRARRPDEDARAAALANAVREAVRRRPGSRGQFLGWASGAPRSGPRPLRAAAGGRARAGCAAG